jgi:hypothetical protein
MAQMINVADVKAAIDKFAQATHAVLAVPGTHKETSLYSQFQDVLTQTIGTVSQSAHPFAFLQQTNADTIGVPDYRVQRGNELQGWIEFKAVVGKDLNNLPEADRDQMARYTAGLDNLIYSTGWQWRLYQHGRQLGKDVVLGPPTMFDPTSLPFAVDQADLDALSTLLGNFVAATPASYASADAAVGALASRARGLKLALVTAGEANAGSHLSALQSDFKALLFKNGMPFTWERFVDSYVQLAVFGGLLWRLETGHTISLSQQVGVDAGLHPLLAQCMAILWSPQSQIPILKPVLEELCITINNIPPSLFAVPKAHGKGGYLADPIVHAYEPFFRVYDRAAREANGVYYTPVEIVEHIVSGIEYHLRNGLQASAGLLDPTARFLDPATGTGTFLLGLASAVADEAVAAGLPIDTMVEQVITEQTSAFELFPGPYAIAHQRLEVALKGYGVAPKNRLPIYLADTLEAPSTGMLPLSGFGPAGTEIQKERERADELKTAEDILVILGNPPYERLQKSKGGRLEPFAQGLRDEISKNTPIANRNDLKSATDLFVVFWAWSLWALQSPATRVATAAAPKIDTSDCHGMIAFITNRTWIVGNSLIGLRQMISKGAKEVWIFDLGGDVRGGHGAKAFGGGDGNVFGIQTGVAIAWVIFDRKHSGGPAIHYRRLFGTKPKKLAMLQGAFDATQYDPVVSTAGAAFMPEQWGTSKVGTSPTIGELFADDAETGLQSARDTSAYSPIGTEPAEVLAEVKIGPGKTQLVGRLADWSRLKASDREKGWATAKTKREKGTKTPLPTSLDPTRLREYAYRPGDIRWLYDDPAWIDWDRPELHAIFIKNRAVPSLVTLPHDHGNGPAAIHVDKIMDQHVFRNADGGKAIYPLWRPFTTTAALPDPRTPTRKGMRCTFSTRIYDWLDAINRPLEIDKAYGYILAVLSAPTYTSTYWRALEIDPLRVPLTADPVVFDTGADHGAELISAWTLKSPKYAALSWMGKATTAPLGAAELGNTGIVFDNGRALAGVTPEAWDFQISGYYVVRGWFADRRHWVLTASQATSSIAFASAIQAIVDLEPKLDALLASATATCV